MSAYLRPASAADGPAVRALIFRILDEYGLPVDPHGTDADLDDIGASYRHGRFWVIEDEGTVLGSCALYPVRDGIVELRKMYLDRSLRGLGWGRRLLETALIAARDDGYTRVELETASVLKEAISLYAGSGFKRVAREPHSDRCDQLWALNL
ncbi:MAG: GNAT family N-acetyltransferase [Gammaproteobacteria bacterium]